MSIMIILSAFAGALIFFAGYYVGNSRHKEEKSSKTPGRKRKPRPPKCAVIALPREGDEEPKKTRKKQSTSERGASNLDNIPGVDINI